MPTRAIITEQRNPRSRDLDLKSTRDILRIINQEDTRIANAVAKGIPAIARAADEIAARLQSGGRLFYVGAGTSGRLGVLDASEIPPTFGVRPRMVQGIIAGGRKALTRAAERAEDSASAGARDLRKRHVGAGDAVVGLTASGSTPYVLGALKYANDRGAFTVAVTSNPGTAVPRTAQVPIVLVTGAEVIAGSTRMKSGTAQKMVLNMLSTAVMVRLGHVYGNWMINVAKTNRKLEGRALRILIEASGANASQARHALSRARHDLPTALVMLKAGINAREARARLKKTHGDLREAAGTGRGNQSHTSGD